MPKNKSAATRYRIIDQCLRNRLKPYPSKARLAEKISDVMDVSVSESTVEKDIRAMKSDPPEGYSAPIEYHPFHRGYYYAEADFSISGLQLTDEEWESLRMASALLYQYAHVPMFRNFKEAIERIDLCFGLGMNPDDPDIEKAIQFEQPHSFTGYDWLPGIHEAIKNRWLLGIRYENIYKDEIKEYQLQPLLLKEISKRWYVIGWVESRNDYLTFALDRIIELQTTEHRQPLRSGFDAVKFFENAIGIMQNNEKPQKILLEIKAPFDKLILLNPLHHSQKTVSHKDKILKAELYLSFNDELYMRLLGLGPFCKILKPNKLSVRIQEMLAQTAKQYD
jgi:predicted DNA-binding transcriptional regulator YafY